MDNAGNGCGLWGLVVVNSLIFIGFAYSFFKPVNLRNWRSVGACSAFIVALFAEMYGSCACPSRRNVPPSRRSGKPGSTMLP